MKRNQITLRPETNEALIHLTDNHVAVLDLEDVPLVQDRYWFLNCKGYAVSQTISRGRRSLIGMHRYILKRKGVDLTAKYVDHINHWRLDNRKTNLRPLTRRQNSIWRKPSQQGLPQGIIARDTKTLGIRYRAQIHYENQTVHIGTYDTVVDAVQARRGKAAELFGDFILEVS